MPAETGIVACGGHRQTRPNRVVTSKSEFGRLMAEVVSRVQPELREAGFRKRRHTFNRTTDEGLVHVVNFQMGQYPLAPDIPPIRYSMWGSFTVNLGVFVPEVHEVRFGEALRFVNEYQCETSLRWRLGEFLDEPIDAWWDLRESLDTQTEEVVALLRDRGLPWLDTFRTRADILLAWEDTGRMEPWRRDKLTIAAMVILAERGDERRARKTLEEYVATIEQEPHKRWVLQEFAPRVGLAGLGET